MGLCTANNYYLFVAAISGEVQRRRLYFKVAIVMLPNPQAPQTKQELK
jgi:hypothetical protein